MPLILLNAATTEEVSILLPLLSDQVPRDFRRTRCWAKRGKRYRTPYYTSRGKGNHNLLPVMTCNGLIDWYITEGSMNSVKIRDFCRKCLVRGKGEVEAACPSMKDSRICI